MMNGTISLNVTNLVNPSSYRPSNFFEFRVETMDGYGYAVNTDSISVTNSIPTIFPSLVYDFTNKVYGGEITNL